jgi:hypothetical protein
VRVARLVATIAGDRFVPELCEPAIAVECTMGLLDQLGGILQQYQSGNPASNPALAAHFDQVASAVPANSLANSIAHAMQSNQTPAFSQMVGTLFSQANPSQRSGILSQLLTAAGSSATPVQAQQMSPEAVVQLAEQAHAANPAVINEMSALFAQHPQLVKGLGAEVLGVVMTHLSAQHR